MFKYIDHNKRGAVKNFSRIILEQQQIEITLWKEICDHQIFIRLNDNDLITVSWWNELLTNALDAWPWELPSPLVFFKAFVYFRRGDLCLSSLNLTPVVHKQSLSIVQTKSCRGDKRWSHWITRQAAAIHEPRAHTFELFYRKQIQSTLP